MREVRKSAAQGDVRFDRVDELPKGAVEVRREGAVIVAHSETGHHHSIHETGVVMFTVPDDPFTCYLRMDIPHADVVHHRPWDTHETLRLLGDGPGSVWRVRRQREWRPEGWAMVQD